MRYSMLVYLKNMSGTLLEAAQYLRTAKDDALRAELLDNGQEMLVQMKDALTKHGADLKSALSINLLEDIIRLWSEAGKNQQLEDLLARFADILPKEVRYQVRAVFFAELGEKWDSMESVYAFMRDDPRFDPVVVLTPVFRIVQRDGKKMQDVIYNDYLTPLGIPFFDYNKYSLEDDCPDLAFICQPYESCTLPQFWPENIAKYTRLVYLPYYLVAAGFTSSIDTLCRMPVFSKAWRVLGVNEKHHEFYSKYSLCGGSNMLVTGLPKLDHLVRLKDHAVPLPNGWEKIKGKKVFLWNTHYIRENSSLPWFEAIVDWFQTHKDCALLWRPHPMTDTVAKLYTPELYAQLHEQYTTIESMSNAILDREASYDAAFHYSDAMISDPSSMEQQYLLMDKPVLHLDLGFDKRVAQEGKAERIIKFIPWEWMEKGCYVENGNQIYTLQLLYEFCERIVCGEDRNAHLRRETREKYLALADGKCGERVCNILWDELHKEDLS